MTRFGPIVLLHVALIGFFLGASIHALVAWWLSRRDRFLATFAVLCMLCAGVTGAWILGVTATDADAARTALVVRYVTNFLYFGAALSLLTTFTAPGLPRPALAAVLALTGCAAAFLVAQPVTGAALTLEVFTYPWGEQITVIDWPNRLWPALGYTAAAVVSAYALRVAWSVFPRDRVLAGFLAFTGGAGLLALVAALAAPGQQRSPFVGTLPLALWVGFLAVYFGQHLTNIRRDLRRSEDRFRALFDGLEVGVVVQDADNRILLTNPAAARTLGLRDDELRGLLSSDPRWQLVREDGRPFEPDQVPSVVAARERRSVRNVVVGTRLPHVGSRMWEVTATPQLGPDGALQHVIVTFVDVTERKQAEAALRASERRLSLAISATSDAVWEVDYQTGAAYYSPRWFEMLGCSPDLPMTVDTWRSLCHPDDVEPTLERIRIALENEEQSAYEVEFRMKRADGTWMWILGRGNVVERDAAGRPRLLAGTNTDITARKDAEARRRELEARLAQAERMESMGRLAGGIAHDFNNLLTVINGYSDLLLSTGQFDEGTREMLADIRDAGDRAASLTKQLLTFSRRQAVTAETLDLNQVVIDTERMLRRLIGEHITLETRLAPAPLWVRADVGQLGQVIVNLAVNGRDAMPQGGTLGVATEAVDLAADEAAERPAARAGRYVTLTVSDSGIGIPAELQAMVFEPFFTTKREGQGTGLGLSTVHGIMQQCGGFLTMDSTPERGSVFRAWFPLADPPAAEVPAGTADAQDDRVRTVLLADDDDRVRPEVASMLRTLGCVVITAAGGDEALRIAARHQGPIDLLLTDVLLPDLPGPELARRVAIIRPDIPVLYISDHSNDPLVRELVALPDAAFLQKPLDAETLVRRVREMMDAPPPVI